jgi:hypothetical protein
MKIIMTRLAVLLLLAAASVWAAAIDGTWLITRSSDKGEIVFELKLKAEGSQLTGTYGRQGGRRTLQIADGKVDGDAFSFTTVQRSKKGENKLVWSGTVSGDELKGESKRDGARRAQPFTAKRK